MGHFIEHLPHDCGSSDGLAVFEEEGKYNGYCFVCDTHVADPYHDRPRGDRVPPRVAKTPEDIEAELTDLGSYQSHDLVDRGLTKETLQYFGIRVGVSQVDGVTPCTHHYPYHSQGKIKAFKSRLISTKGMWITGSIKKCDLFGWDLALAAGAKRLFITEGELDAAALYQALKAKSVGTVWEDRNPAVVSLRNGASGAKKDITTHASAIRANFKEVVLLFDRDEAGKKATEEVLLIYPTATTVDFPGKDPNECVMAGRSKALANAALFKAATPKNTRLVWGTAMHTLGRQQAQWGLSWPWEGLTTLTRGMRFGETYYLGAGVKMGKSEVVNTLGAHLIIDHGLKVFMAKPEESNRKTHQMVCGKVAGRIFHDPTIPFDFEAYDRISPSVGESLCMLSLYQHLGWDSLRSDIMVAVQEGCKAIFIDPITNLVNGIASGETNTILQEIAQELAALAKDLNIIVFIFCHLKAPDYGAAHERGGKVLSHQFSGSRAMMRSCNLMLGLEGNKDPDLPEEQRNVRKLVILEDREFGASGYIQLYWDKNTSLFNEMQER